MLQDKWKQKTICAALTSSRIFRLQSCQHENRPWIHYYLHIQFYLSIDTLHLHHKSNRLTLFGITILANFLLRIARSMNMLRAHNAELPNARAGSRYGNCCVLKRHINKNMRIMVWEQLPRRHSHPRGITKGQAWRATRYRNISELASWYKKLKRQVRNEESLQCTSRP